MSASIILEPSTTRVLPLRVTDRAIIIAQIAEYASIYVAYGSSQITGNGNAVVAELINNNPYFTCFSNSTGQIGVGNSNTGVAQRLTVFYL